MEEQFYLVWPLLLVIALAFAARGTLRAVTVLLSVTWLLSLISVGCADPALAHGILFLLCNSCLELATGALLALAGHLLPHLPRLARHALSALGLVGLVVAAVSYDASTPFPGWHALLPVLGAAALLAGGAAGEVGAGRLLTLPPLRYLGTSRTRCTFGTGLIVLGAKYVGRSRSTTETAVTPPSSWPCPY